MRTEIIPDPRRIASFLGIVSLYLAVQSLFGEHLLENVLSGDIDSPIIQFIDLLSVNAEQTIPTWYATVLLFVAAALLAFIAAFKQSNRDPYRRHWIGLAIIFGYLSMDEGAVIHEIMADPLQAAFNTSGYLAFSWQIAAVPLLVIFVLVYLRFLLRLPPSTRNLFILAGSLYVGGALVVEAISANRWYVDGGVSFPYLAIGTIEELFEMLGMVVFIYALLTYMGELDYTAVLDFSRANRTALSDANSPGARTSRSRKWVLGAALAVVVGANLALFSWASNQQAEVAASDPASTPFYRRIVNRYAGQGVITLQINELLEPGNTAASPVATSLLTLFDDVLVVALPQERSSVAFAGQQLPFDRSILSEALNQSGEDRFTILDTAALRGIAANTHAANADCE